MWLFILKRCHAIFAVYPSVFVTIVTLCTLLLPCAKAQSPGAITPVQFCKQDSELRIDFCLAVQPYHNSSTDATDLFITITRNHSASSVVRREPHDEDAETDEGESGWLGIGIGSQMKGALMMIVYSDSSLDSGSDVVTSIRTAPGHEEPNPLSDSSNGDNPRQPQIQILKSENDDSVSAKSAKRGRCISQLVIYSSNLWAGTTIDGTSTQQPWIWAHHPSQAVTSSTKLKMHSHDQNKGYGYFWTDFSISLSQPRPQSPQPPSPSPLPPNTLQLSTISPPASARLGSPTVRNWMWHIHGTLFSLSFLILSPLATILLRSSSPYAFNFHWTLQSLSTISALLAGALGYVLSRRIVLVHQYLGLVVLAALGLQALLGWRHHVGFLKTHTKSLAGNVHVYLGRTIILLAWANLLLGLWQRRYGWLVLAGTGFSIAATATALWVYIHAQRDQPSKLFTWLRRRGVHVPRPEGTSRGAAAGGSHATETQREEGGLREEYFELVPGRNADGGEAEDSASEDEDYDEDGRLRADVEWEDLMRQQGRLPGQTGERRGSEGGVQLVEGAEEGTAKRLARLDVV